MADEAPVDYYEALQISVTAEPETVHRVYRLLAQRYHPDNGETGSDSKFRQIADAYREFARTHPIGRQGDPEDDIGPVALFLCSDGCRYLTGQTFMVDGGAFLFA